MTSAVPPGTSGAIQEDTVSHGGVLSGEALYEHAASGSDFHIALHCQGRYDEYYFNPDCVLLFPKTKDLVWFDLDPLTVSRFPSGGMRHRPWDLQNRKFAFSYARNTIQVLEYTLLHLQVQRTQQMVWGPGDTQRYFAGEPYRKLCTCGPAGITAYWPELDLDTAWRLGVKLKVGVVFESAILIYPIRLVYRDRGVHSFASKNVVIPHRSMETFSWEQASVGNLCVSSDGTCSQFRLQKRRRPIANALVACYPPAVTWLARILCESGHPLKARIKRALRPIIEPVLQGVSPYHLEYSACTFTVFARLNGMTDALRGGA